RLDGFHHRARLASLDDAARVGDLDEHQVPEGVLGVIGDADLNRAVGECPHPFMRPGVLKISWNGAHDVTPTSALPLRTNGGFTTRAFRSLPRMSTCQRPPGPAGHP